MAQRKARKPQLSPYASRVDAAIQAQVQQWMKLYTHRLWIYDKPQLSHATGQTTTSASTGTSTSASTGASASASTGSSANASASAKPGTTLVEEKKLNVYPR